MRPCLNISNLRFQGATNSFNQTRRTFGDYRPPPHLLAGGRAGHGSAWDRPTPHARACRPPFPRPLSKAPKWSSGPSSSQFPISLTDATLSFTVTTVVRGVCRDGAEIMTPEALPCSANFTTAACLCDPHWAGTTCERPACPGDCLGHGLCTLLPMCDAGFGGVDCRARVCPADCSGHGTCNAGACVTRDGPESRATSGCALHRLTAVATASALRASATARGSGRATPATFAHAPPSALAAATAAPTARAAAIRDLAASTAQSTHALPDAATTACVLLVCRLRQRDPQLSVRPRVGWRRLQRTHVCMCARARACSRCSRSSLCCAVPAVLPVCACVRVYECWLLSVRGECVCMRVRVC